MQRFCPLFSVLCPLNKGEVEVRRFCPLFSDLCPLLFDIVKRNATGCGLLSAVCGRPLVGARGWGRGGVARRVKHEC